MIHKRASTSDGISPFFAIAAKRDRILNIIYIKTRYYKFNDFNGQSIYKARVLVHLYDEPRSLRDTYIVCLCPQRFVSFCSHKLRISGPAH